MFHLAKILVRYKATGATKPGETTMQEGTGHCSLRVPADVQDEQ